MKLKIWKKYFSVVCIIENFAFGPCDNFVFLTNNKIIAKKNGILIRAKRKKLHLEILNRNNSQLSKTKCNKYKARYTINLSYNYNNHNFIYKDIFLFHESKREALITNGSKKYYRNGMLHSIHDIPAMVTKDYKYFFKNGVLHRSGDKAAIIKYDGELSYYKKGLLHRSGDNPAVIKSNGSISYYKKGLLHRRNGPAVISQEAIEYYYKGKLHRTDGPAYINSKGSKLYFVKGMHQYNFIS